MNAVSRSTVQTGRRLGREGDAGASAGLQEAPLLEVQVSRYAYPGGQPVLQQLDLKLFPGSIVGLMGPNGCGKSTALLLLAGELHAPSVTRSSALREEEIALVVQDYRSSLFAWKSALANLVLPLRLRRENRRLIEQRAAALAAELDLPSDLTRHPRQLSGGEQQKLCVVRALLERPRLLLLDESFSAMDYKSRLLFIQRLRLHLRESDTAALLVSHSAEETFLFCDRLLLMKASGVISHEIPDCQSKATYVANLERVHAHFLA